MQQAAEAKAGEAPATKAAEQGAAEEEVKAPATTTTTTTATPTKGAEKVEPQAPGAQAAAEQQEQKQEEEQRVVGLVEAAVVAANPSASALKRLCLSFRNAWTNGEVRPQCGAREGRRGGSGAGLPGWVCVSACACVRVCVWGSCAGS